MTPRFAAAQLPGGALERGAHLVQLQARPEAQRSTGVLLRVALAERSLSTTRSASSQITLLRMYYNSIKLYLSTIERKGDHAM